MDISEMKQKMEELRSEREKLQGQRSIIEQSDPTGMFGMNDPEHDRISSILDEVNAHILNLIKDIWEAEKPDFNAEDWADWWTEGAAKFSDMIWQSLFFADLPSHSQVEESKAAERGYIALADKIAYAVLRKTTKSPSNVADCWARSKNTTV